MTADVSYRRDDVTAPAGEGWPRGRADPFILTADYGPIGVTFHEDIVNDVALWAAGESRAFDAVTVSLAVFCDDGEATAVAYMDPDAARAFAAQVLTAADAVDRGERFSPNVQTSDEEYRP